MQIDNRCSRISMTDASGAHLRFQGPKPAVSANTAQIYGKSHNVSW